MLPKTGIKTVVIVGISDLLPPLKRFLISAVQKYVKKMIPPITFSHTTMARALWQGAERITAGPGSRTYGRLSVLAGWRTQARILFDIAPQAFVPPPKVISSLVEVVPRREPLACDAKALQRVTEAAFGQRRKMLRQSLKSLGGDPLALLARAGIEPTARAEDIAVEGFVALTRASTLRID